MKNQIKPNSVKIRELRIKKGLNLRDLSKLSGVNVAVVSKLENCKGCPSPKTAKAIVDALGASFDELFEIV